MILDLPRFLKAQQPGWQELEKMLQRVEDDPGARWSIAELKRFHYLYQRAGADLAKLQTFASEPDLCRYLESLVSRAYAEVHETQRQRRRLRPLHWFLTLFPAAFQLHIRAFWLSLAITMGGALFGAGVVALDIKRAAELLRGRSDDFHAERSGL